MDSRARVRLDAIACYLQDAAIEDVEETGWGLPDHLWFIRSIRMHVLVPLVGDREVELLTWCSGLAAIAAGRRWSLTGDRGGRIEVDSVWVHLGPDQRPARIEGFGVYEEATEGRPVSTRLELADPPSDAARSRWALRSADVDLHGHVNNAVYWQAVEDCLALAGRPDAREPLLASLEYRAPVDLGDPLELHWVADSSSTRIGFSVNGRARAAALVERI